jgi:hypothetical protein
MGAIAPVSTINRLVKRVLKIILLMSTWVIGAEVCIFALVSALFRQPSSIMIQAYFVQLGPNIILRRLCQITYMQSAHNTDIYIFAF